METASWVIREKATGKVLFETFNRKKIEALNTATYEAVPILEYLASLNNQPQMPLGMVEVDKEAFFRALSADTRDIMPNNINPYYCTWEDKQRNVWGWSTPGWKNPRSPRRYAIFPAAMVSAPKEIQIS